MRVLAVPASVLVPRVSKPAPVATDRGRADRVPILMPFYWEGVTKVFLATCILIS